MCAIIIIAAILVRRQCQTLESCYGDAPWSLPIKETLPKRHLTYHGKITDLAPWRDSKDKLVQTAPPNAVWSPKKATEM
jgi:hypothetical protein